MSELIELAPTPQSVAAARRWCLAVAERVGSPEVAETLELLVSELVSNVVLHARTACALSVHREGDRLRVEVRDGNARMPGATIQTDSLAVSGRGMVLIDALSVAHGAQALVDGGKLVWFELDAPERPR
jgi:anti-sigma regulatory factor (Ser/Thr protein kinase)